MSSFSRQSFATTDGLNLVGDVAGPSGEPAVLLLHGGGQTRHSWAGAMRRLVDRGYFVINYDARGHGDSDWSPSGDYSLAALVADLRAVRSTVSQRAALVGASMGGVTSFYAIGSSDVPIAEALVMVDIVLSPAAAGVKKIRDFMTAHSGGFMNPGEAADAVAAYNPDRPRPADAGGLLKNLRQRDDGRLYWHWDPRFLEAHPSAEPPSFAEEMIAVSDRVRIPTLLVRGGRSEIVDDQGVTQMRKLVPQTQVYEIPGAGHMVAGDRNDAFNDGVMQFLERYHPVR